MEVKPKTKLTNIRPREVSLVDEPANQKDFLITKSKDGKTEPVKSNDGGETGKEKPVLKKMEVAVHTVNFFKDQYPDVETCKKLLISQGMNPDEMEMQDLNWEYRFTVNPESAFEGTSLAFGTYVPMAKGCDSMVGVLKSLKGVNEELIENWKKEFEAEIEKKGAKFSKSNLEQLQKMYESLGGMLKAAGIGSEEPTKKEDDGDTEPTKKDGDGDKDVDIAKRLEALEKNMKDQKEEHDAELKKRDDKIEELQKKLDEKPADPAGSGDPENTQKVEKSQKNFWSGVL